MNPGRRATPIGDDGIEPYVMVPHWFTSTLVRELRRHRVDYRIAVAYVQLADSDDPDDHADRIVFPGGRPEVMQFLIDRTLPDWVPR